MTTWKISVEGLSQKAYKVLRAIAMLGEGDVGEAMVNRILKMAIVDETSVSDDLYRNIVIEELVYGSSLVSWDKGVGGRVSRIHRLVRRFILDDMEHGSVLCNESYGLALVSVYQLVESELLKEGGSFNELPDIFGNIHLEFIPHALALVNYHEPPASSNDLERFAVHFLACTSRKSKEEDCSIFQYVVLRKPRNMDNTLYCYYP